MKWTKLDGFNQPKGLTLMRWNDHYDDKADGYLYAVGHFENECLYYYSNFYGNEIRQFHIMELMNDDACFVNLENFEDPI